MEFLPINFSAEKEIRALYFLMKKEMNVNVELEFRRKLMSILNQCL